MLLALMPGFVFIRLDMDDRGQVGQRLPQLVFKFFRQPVRFHKCVRIGNLDVNVYVPV